MARMMKSLGGRDLAGRRRYLRSDSVSPQSDEAVYLTLVNTDSYVEVGEPSQVDVSGFRSSHQSLHRARQPPRVLPADEVVAPPPVGTAGPVAPRAGIE